MYTCWYCGAVVSWIGDFMESEVSGGEIPEEHDRVVGYYKCPGCGSDYEFRQGPGWDGEEE
jgi:DNA-directed RNA polymerase subunit RPC12/RpoP